ncbi:MAG: prepilin-type N-terminal cleavage/methylation domain-containing protein [Pseudomonadota bacterium]
MKHKQQGFTLMEMIGVIAVIAILASMATPMIFEAIRNAKISAFVEDVNVLRTSVASYYEDTGQFPVHIPNDSRDGRKLLTSNGTARPVAGWDGPYIEKEFANPFRENGYRAVLTSGNANYQFDLDGDGSADTSGVAVIRVDNVSDTDAKRISDILDGDGDVDSGDGAWNKAGRVKRYGVAGTHRHVLIIFLSRT